MKMKNKAAYMREINTMYFKEVEMTEITPKEVIVKIECCGICGSDVHYYNLKSEL